MRKSLSFFLLPLLCLAQGTPTGEQILDRYVEATGGKTNYEKVRGETVTGVMELKAQGIRGRMSGFKNSKGETYNVVDIDGVGKLEDGYINGVAWEKTAMNGPRIKSGEEKAFFEREARLAKDLRWRESYSKAELTGEEVVEGVPCYKVVVTPKEAGRPETRFYEKETGLLKKNTAIMVTPNGDIPAESFFSAYKAFNGVKVPTTIVTRMAGQEMQISIASVDYSTDVTTAKLAPPPEVLALMKKAGKP